MSNLVTDLLPWLLLLQLVLHQVSARGFSPVSKDTLRTSRQLHETNIEDFTLVDTLVTTDTIDTEYWYRRMFGVELSPEELTCARNGTILHRESQQCHWLLEQGPCAPSEWLVLAEGASERPACRPRPCAPRHALLAGEEPPRCAPHAALCAQRPDRELRFSLRGDARCQCKGFRAQGPDGRCHLLYSQGACPPGQVLVPAFNRSVGGCAAACQPAPCAEGEVQMEAPEDSDDAPAGTRCADFAELQCASQVVPLFTLDVDIQVPVCDVSQRSLFATPRLAPRRRRPDHCLHDAAGRCLEVIVLASEPFAWRARPQAEGEAKATNGASRPGPSGSFLPALLPLVFAR